MKLNVLLVFAMVFIQAQTYKFDYFMKFSDTHSGIKGERVIQLLVDSSEKYRNITLERNEKETNAILYDWDNKIIHHFIMLDTNFPISSKSFQYKYSEKIKKLASEEHRIFTTSILKEDKDETHIKVVQTDRNSKNESEAILKLIPFDKNLAPFQMIYLFDHQYIGDQIKFDKNYILKEGEIKFYHPDYGNVVHKLKILNLNKQEFELKLDPEKIVYK